MPRDTVQLWQCENCGIQQKATVHRLRNRFCSRACAKSSVVKASAETWRARREILARDVATLYQSTGSFAETAAALSISRSRVCMLAKEFGIQRARAIETSSCLTCGETFPHYQSNKRKYCSSECFYSDGGAQRAGEASIRAVKKYGAKKDANHNEIFDMIGTFTAVKDLSAAGFGVPDGLAWVNDGWRLFDVKNPKSSYGKKGLNPRQKKWADDWRGGPVYLIYSVEEAEKFARGNLDQIKRFPDDVEARA